MKCGTQLPDDAQFCVKCGVTVQAPTEGGSQATGNVSQPVQTIAPAGVSELKCPTCGAPI